MAQVIPASPQGQTMARDSSSTNPCTLFDPLGYARITNLYILWEDKKHQM